MGMRAHDQAEKAAERISNVEEILFPRGDGRDSDFTRIERGRQQRRIDHRRYPPTQ